MKTIFITVFDGAIAKNILRTDVFEILKSKFKIVLLVPPEKQDYYRKEFAHENVIVEALPMVRNRLDLLFLHLGFESLHTQTVTNRQKNYLRKSRNYLQYGLRRILWFLGQFRLWREFLRGLYCIIPSRSFTGLLQKYEPDLVFAPNSISTEDIQLLKEAKKHKIKTLGMIKSWDSLTSKTLLITKPDYLIVHNDIIRKEAINLGDFPGENLFVSGVPQWDVYCDKNALLKKEEFFKKIGADPSKKLIFFSASGGWIAPTDGEVIKIIDAAISGRKVNFPAQILVRPHPKYQLDETVKECHNIILDRPGKYLGQALRGWEFEKEDILHLANSLCHCDLMINTASTVTIEACIFDKPVINIAFDGLQKKDFFESVARFYTSNHYRNIIKTGGIKVVRNPAELIAAINFYFLNPQADNEGRKKIRDEQCYELDGKSGERIATFIRGLLEK